MKRWVEVSPYSGIEEDAPANNASSGDVSMPPDAVMDKKKKKRDDKSNQSNKGQKCHAKDNQRATTNKTQNMMML